MRISTVPLRAFDVSHLGLHAFLRPHRCVQYASLWAKQWPTWIPFFIRARQLPKKCIRRLDQWRIWLVSRFERIRLQWMMDCPWKSSCLTYHVYKCWKLSTWLCTFPIEETIAGYQGHYILCTWKGYCWLNMSVSTSSFPVALIYVVYDWITAGG